MNNRARYYFNDLATAIDRSIKTGKERIGNLIEKCGKPLASVLGKEEVVDRVKSIFSGADIEELRE